MKVVEDAIAQHKAVLFSKSYCPYCIKAKKLLDSAKVQYVTFELDKRGDGKQMQEYIGQKTGEFGVPTFFYQHEYFGDDGDIEEGLNKLK